MKVLKKRQRTDKEEEKNEDEKKNEVPNFLLKLYQILDKKEYSDIISWGDNGKYFIVKNLNAFSDTILPIYFKHNNFASFVRQVSI
jgi:hypothetical protein